MASVLLTGFTPGKRAALPYSKILIHQPWIGQIGGQASDIELHARDLVARAKRSRAFTQRRPANPKTRFCAILIAIFT